MNVWTQDVMKKTLYWKEKKIILYSEPPAKTVSLIKLEENL